jgi:hypothetical protein
MEPPVDFSRRRCYNQGVAFGAVKKRVSRMLEPRQSRLGVFAPLVGALVFKTSGGFEQSSLWVRFPYTPAIYISINFKSTYEEKAKITLSVLPFIGWSARRCRRKQGKTRLPTANPCLEGYSEFRICFCYRPTQLVTMGRFHIAPRT